MDRDLVRGDQPPPAALAVSGTWLALPNLSRARFRLTLPKGVSRLRIAMSVNQAGIGYLAAFSRTVTVRKK